ncbi:DedA family protein [Austwickia chelonae]|uniref:DedA family protein n=1 Tax=Austwickia chelonae TaxID=100225 RepID=UPI000E25F291|nr:VTT domain-containing protein [Austwickia chelonae]
MEGWSDLNTWPFAALYVFFLFGALARSQATYWTGRGLRVGGERSRVARRLDRPAVHTAERLVARWGAPIIVLSFLTIGVQTAINLAAGALRMPMRRYFPAAFIGSLIWAAIYTTIGFAVLEAWIQDEAGPWLIVMLIPIALIVVATWAFRRESRRGATGGSTDPSDSPLPPAALPEGEHR